jgi:hypothetical protein
VYFLPGQINILCLFNIEILACPESFIETLAGELAASITSYKCAEFLTENAARDPSGRILKRYHSFPFHKLPDLKRIFNYLGLIE